MTVNKCFNNLPWATPNYYHKFEQVTFKLLVKVKIKMYGSWPNGRASEWYEEGLGFDSQKSQVAFYCKVIPIYELQNSLSLKVLFYNGARSRIYWKITT
ncbi:Uncharacterized protein APZ42_009593 [Daphnia magna]|uniref:Uncharacterized protein n=1 Tax=Daphnia magna TaxID=35525 RepID=A0A0P6I913_9CRUS|nr:Uncharacterized protein APZ42_009593 [Daphnia magna]